MMNKEELLQKIHELKSLKIMADELAAEITAIEDTIKQEMTAQGVDTLTVDVYKISWKTVTSSRLDTTAIKHDLPELAAKYTKTTESRRFTVN